MESHQTSSPPAGTANRCSDLPLGEGANLTVRDLMQANPKTLPSDAKVGDLRRLFANSRVLNVLLVDGSAFVGVIDRVDVDERSDDAPAQALAHSVGVAIEPEATVNDAMARLEERGTSRLVVLGSDGVTLEGLLCLNANGTGFCR